MRNPLPIAAVILAVAAMIFALRIDAKATSAYNNACQIAASIDKIEAEVNQLKDAVAEIQQSIAAMLNNAQTPPTANPSRPG
jgi:cell division protein FtsL